MTRPLSNDRRRRVVRAAVDGGMTRWGVAKRFCIAGGLHRGPPLQLVRCLRQNNFLTRRAPMRTLLVRNPG